MTASCALSVLCRAPAERVKGWADELLAGVDASEVQVTSNATGLVLLPMQDTVRGGPFLLGEVLVAEAQVTLRGADGYAAVLGRDLQRALAVALLDAASRLDGHQARVAALVEAEREVQRAADERTLREVEATRVAMETF